MSFGVGEWYSYQIKRVSMQRVQKPTQLSAQWDLLIIHPNGVFFNGVDFGHRQQKVPLDRLA